MYDGEVAVHGEEGHSGWSGGGFSIVHERPHYQDKVSRAAPRLASLREIGPAMISPSAMERLQPRTRTGNGKYEHALTCCTLNSQAVSTYFEAANLSIPYFTDGAFRNNNGRYNRNGRGFPDISAGRHADTIFIGILSDVGSRHQHSECSLR